MDGGRYRGEGRVDKQTGGHGQKAYCAVEIHALPRGAGFAFGDRTSGGVIPKQFIGSIEKGVKTAMETGPLAGFPVVDIAVDVVDGAAHQVDSNDYAFAEAGRLALKDACAHAPMMIIEPIAKLEVDTPKEYVGSVIGDLCRRRAQITGQSTMADGSVTVSATVAIAEMIKYATDLRSLTQGRAGCTMTPVGYDEVPDDVSRQLIEARRK